MLPVCVEARASSQAGIGRAFGLRSSRLRLNVSKSFFHDTERRGVIAPSQAFVFLVWSGLVWGLGVGSGPGLRARRVAFGISGLGPVTS